MNIYQGQRIRCRGEEWQVRRAQSYELVNGKTVWEVQARGVTGLVQGMDFAFVSDIDDIEVIDPTQIEPELDTSGRARRAKLFWEAHLRRLLPRNGALYLGQHGACNPYEYQLEPAARALDLIRPRLLIGDAVGLGKTVECGILLSELIRRGRASRVLCAVPKAVLEQFQNEMWGRFAIPFHRLDSKGLERLRQDLPSTMNPFYHFNKVIISIDTLKLRNYQKLLEECQWDVLIVDECHNVADRTNGGGGSARHRTIKRIANTANAVVLMSATPHDGTKQGFASLIKLLDRTCISKDEDYKVTDFAKHFIRRSRTEVAGQLSERGPRKTQICDIPMSSDEIDLLQSIHTAETFTSYLNQTTRRGSRELFKTTLVKSFLSSPQALLTTVQNKQRSLQARKRPDHQDLHNFEEFLRDLEQAIQALKGFSRFDHLGEFIKETGVSNTNRLVIFTERIATMEAIAQYLVQQKIVDGCFDPKNDTQGKGILLATASGKTSDIDLQAIVKGFQASKNGCQILVTTNVASEGLNLHQNCHRLIHFDLPWSMITLEQRNGRIDRLGQNKRPEIYYFASRATSDTKETKAAELKDDFWIVEKIQNRLKIAGEDMDEQALVRFLDSATEEEENSVAYQENTEVDRETALLDMIYMTDDSPSESDESTANPIKRKTLASLYEKSPADFIKGVCAEANLDFTEKSTHRVEIKLKDSMRYEINQWPKEYQPLNDRLQLEADPKDMERYYEKCLAMNTYIDRSFMNEIHPFMSLLENTAIGFFKGSSVPTVGLKGERDGCIHFLVQSTLFNQCNDVAMQYWQLLSFPKGPASGQALVAIDDNDHALTVANWLNEHLGQIKRKNELTRFEANRIKRLAQAAVETMREATLKAREQRGKDLKPMLKAELDRIRQWEKNRQSYLQAFTENQDLATHGGMHSQVRRAKDELEHLNRDSRAYNEFIKQYLTTNQEADIRILGCFVEEA
jgi:superfamily II DNA or RNA helicase